MQNQPWPLEISLLFLLLVLPVTSYRIALRITINLLASDNLYFYTQVIGI